MKDIFSSFTHHEPTERQRVKSQKQVGFELRQRETGATGISRFVSDVGTQGIVAAPTVVGPRFRVAIQLKHTHIRFSRQSHRRVDNKESQRKYFEKAVAWRQIS